MDRVRFGSVLLSIGNKRLFYYDIYFQTASHAGNGGSNPPGDANKIKGLGGCQLQYLPRLAVLVGSFFKPLFVRGFFIFSNGMILPGSRANTSSRATFAPRKLCKYLDVVVADLWRKIA